MENACFPNSLFSLLISKMDSLTFTVQSQRGELLDVERRLKNEFKSREKVQLDQIASLEKKIVENETYNTNSVRRNSRTEHIEKSSKRLDSGFGKEKVRGNGYSQQKKMFWVQIKRRRVRVVHVKVKKLRCAPRMTLSSLP